MTEPTITTAVAKRRLNDDQLRGITDFASAIAAAGPIMDIAETELSSGFSVCQDKSLLVGVPLIILDWSFSEGDQGEFVSVLVITKDNRKLIINDGSTGIYAQLKRLPKLDGNVLGVHKGLRRSDYDRRDENGNLILSDKTGRPERATTYYLDTSAAQ